MSSHSESMILLTGAGGFLGKGFLASLKPEQAKRILCVSREATPEMTKSCGKVVEGLFGDLGTLHHLDSYPISAVVHLAAVTGGCSEEDASAINVEATRVLMRYLIDHACKRFVLASSIAVVGIQRPDFRPLSLPIPDEHPSFDRDGYGFSKYLMEEQARYFCRQNPAISVACLRFGSICPDDAIPEPYEPTTPRMWTYGYFSTIARKDAVRAIHLALEKPDWPGTLIANIVGRKANLAGPVEQLVKTWYPDWKPDLSSYQLPGHEYDALYSVERAEKELGFVAEWPPK